MVNGFSVIMPTYNRAYFIRRAILSLQRQTYPEWELVIVNDGSTDSTEEMIKDFLHSPNIQYIGYEKNQGMGYALNRGLEVAKYDHIAYLPSDDFYYANHLETLKTAFETDSRVVLAYSGLNFSDTDAYGPHDYINSTTMQAGHSLQLVQTAHRKTEDKWMERSECVTDDLFVMFWHKLCKKGMFMPTLQITAKWMNHPWQRHRICGENYRGNLFKYKSFYHIDQAIRIRMSRHRKLDEKKLASTLSHCIPKPMRMKILIIGVLGYNPERLCAWEEAGCKLYGLWMPTPSMAHESIGPFPFGHIENIGFATGWTNTVKDKCPDLIYAPFSSSSVEFVYDCIMALRKDGINIPFVWHLKEGPQICMRYGTWPKLMELYRLSAGNILLNQRTKEWFDLFVPTGKPFLLQDQEYPKKEFFEYPFSEKLSASDGEIHTVISGRMVGLSVEDMRQLATHHIHVHLYSESYYKEKIQRNNLYEEAAPGFFHIHTHCPNEKWVEEFSRYDAGWLHCSPSHNEGDLFRLMWDDLNIPARIGTMAAAGLPMIQRRNARHIVASRDDLDKRGMTILYDSIPELITLLNQPAYMDSLRKNVLDHRMEFTMDYHIGKLMDFFQTLIKKR